jgi:hypothetical protein
MQDSGKPEDAGTAKPEGAGTEATRGTISRRQGSGNSGQPGNSNPRQSRKVQSAGQPDTTLGGAAGKRSRGATRSSSAGSTEGREIRGDSKIRRRQSRKMQSLGKPRGHIRRRNWNSEDAGQPGDLMPVALKDARFEATRRSIAGKAGRCGSRGNPGDVSRGATGGPKPRGNLELHRWERQRMRNSRQLEDPSPAEPEDAGCGATRSPIGRRDRESGAEGQPKVPEPDELKDARIGATRNSIAGTAFEMQDSGKPGT